MSSKPSEPNPHRETNHTQDKSPPSEGMSRRTFVRLGTTAAVALPLLGLQAACPAPPTTEPAPEPPSEVSQENGPEPTTPDASPNEALAETRPDAPPDPQDLVDPQTYDKAKEETWDPTALTEDKTTFPMGVMSGAMTAKSAILWGFAEDKQDKTIRVWRPHQDKGKVLLASETKGSQKDGFFHVKVNDLAPGTWYQFAFLTSDGKRSEIGRFRTAWIETSKKPLVIAGTTCTNFRNMPYTSLQVTAEYDIDFFVHLGDMVYNDGSKTRADFRQKWRRTLLDPGYRAILPKVGHYMTWDDHEITDNSRLYDLPKAQRREGIEAFFENTVVERIKDDRFWTSYRWGQTAEIFVIDSRGERLIKNKEQNARYISPEQMNWLKQTLQDSPCHFKIVLNSVPMIDWNDSAIGSGLQSDRWQGHPDQRNELLNHIDTKKIENVWWLSGDFHVGTVGRLNANAPHNKMWEILVGPGANGPNPAWILYKDRSKEDQEVMFPATQFPYFGGEFAATIMTFDPAKDNVTVEFIHHKTKQTLFKQTLSYGSPT